MMSWNEIEHQRQLALAPVQPVDECLKCGKKLYTQADRDEHFVGVMRICIMVAL